MNCTANGIKGFLLVDNTYGTVSRRFADVLLGKKLHVGFSKVQQSWNTVGFSVLFLL